jgi:PAS domain-containing protein
MRRPLLVYGGLALLLAAIDLVLPAHGLGQPRRGPGAGIAVGMRDGTRRHAPRSKAPWFLLMLTNVLAVVAVALHSAVGGGALDLPMPSDVLILASLVTWCVASALFVRARSQVLDRYLLLDLGIILVSAMVALKRLALDPLLAANPAEGMSPSLSMAMILLELAAIVLFVRFTTLRGPRPTSMWLLLTSLVVSMFGSVVSNAVSPELGLHLALFGSGVATMFAALHPSMSMLTEPSPASAPSFGPVRAALLGVAVVLPPVTAALVHARTDDLPLLWFVAPTVVVTTLVLLRFRLQFEHERSAQAELEVSRAQFRALIHGISDIILVLGDGDVVRYASASCETTLGVRSETLLGRRIGDLVHPSCGPSTPASCAASRPPSPTGWTTPACAA